MIYDNDHILYIMAVYSHYIIIIIVIIISFFFIISHRDPFTAQRPPKSRIDIMDP